LSDMTTKTPAQKAASALGKLRAQKLTKTRRSEIARMGGLAGGRGREKKDQKTT